LPKDLEESICKATVFERIYNTYVKDLHDFLYYKYGGKYNPNDITQEAFIKLWDHCNKVSLSKAKSFLFTVANNMVLNDIKHQKVVLKFKQLSPKQHTNETPEYLMEKEQYFEQYKKVLENLNDEHRVAFLMSKVEGKKHSEIAELLGVSQKVVEYRIYTAFNTLRKELDGFKIK